MKSKILLLALTVALLSSCTTAYKTGQTPDDVYYSPAQPQKEDNKVNKDDDRDYTYSDEYYDDRYLRMKVSNRYRWNDLNDWYSYDRYSFGYNYHYGSYYNPYNSWNYYYNPYYCCCNGNTNYNYSNPKVASVKPIVKPTNFNLAGYTNGNYNNSNTNTNGKGVIRYNNNRPAYNNTNSDGTSKGAGGVIRTIFESNNNNNNNSGSSNSSSSRTYTPSSNNSSSSGSSGSSSGGSSSSGSVKRPGRD
jgi:uncharacterized membrane protein YgcG